MDKIIIRDKAKKKYKEMMKGVPKRERPPFKQVYPMLKAMVLRNDAPPIKGTTDLVDNEDVDMINDMIIDFAAGTEDGSNSTKQEAD